MEKRKLELAFIDKNGKVYPIDEVTQHFLAGTILLTEIVLLEADSRTIPGEDYLGY